VFFKDVIGQDLVKAFLLKQVADDEIPHAQLFAGPEGGGKLALVLAYARFLLCQNRGEQDACGSCPSCVKVSSLQHPDLHFSFPIIAPAKSGQKKVSDLFLDRWRARLMNNPYFTTEDWKDDLVAENKQLNIAVDEAESIIRKLTLAAYGGTYRIMIICLPEFMNAQTANKLLKQLEEPGPGTLFMMVCHDTEQLLSTILSRMQVTKVHLPSEEVLSTFLIENHGLSQERALEIAHFVDGNVNEAYKLLTNNMSNNEHFEQLAQWMRACYSNDAQQLVPIAEKLHKSGREAVKSFLEYALHFFRQCIVANYGREELTRLTADEAKFASKFAPFINHLNVLELTEAIEAAHNDVSRNVYTRLVLLHTSFQVHKLLRRAE